MSENGSPRRYDAAVVGAGPTGSFAALALARTGARVALYEANPNASRRLAGEWLHPPALRALRKIGIEFNDESTECAEGKGFVVFPGDGSSEVHLPYVDGSRGMSCEHGVIVARLHEAVEREPGIDFEFGARVTAVEDGQLEVARNGSRETVLVDRIVGADGRSSVVRRSLNLEGGTKSCSTMIGMQLCDVNLPFEGYGHLLCGKPGPILIYRLGQRNVRMLIDLPGRWSKTENWIETLADAYAELLSPELRNACLEALREKRFSAAANRVEPRLSYGTERRILLGDAVGHYHPLTAVGMTFGFGDALALAESNTFEVFTARRIRETRGPGLLAMGVYEVFSDRRSEVVAVRHAIFEHWRLRPGMRRQTARYLACEDTSVVSLSMSFASAVVTATFRIAPRSLNPMAWARAGGAVAALLNRIGWLVRGVYRWRTAPVAERDRIYASMSRAFRFSMLPRNPAASRSTASSGPGSNQ